MKFASGLTEKTATIYMDQGTRDHLTTMWDLSPNTPKVMMEVRPNGDMVLRKERPMEEGRTLSHNPKVRDLPYSITVHTNNLKFKPCVRFWKKMVVVAVEDQNELVFIDPDDDTKLGPREYTADQVRKPRKKPVVETAGTHKLVMTNGQTMHLNPPKAPQFPIDGGAEERLVQAIQEGWTVVHFTKA